VHGLALEVLRDARVALVAAALTVVTPLFLFHSGLELAYLFTTLLATLTITSGLRTVRSGSTLHALITGGLLGAVLLTRPFDGVLTGMGLLAAVGFIGCRRPRRDLITLTGYTVIGALPFIALTLLFNVATTGTATTFPLSASDPRNTFGFGERAMQVGTGSEHYDLSSAVDALQRNLRGAVGWLPGGLVAVGLAGWSALRRPRRPRLFLVASAALYPVAYLFWWSTAWSATAATNGIGPHYYLPAFVPVLLLVADGLTHLARRHVVAAVLVVLLGVGAIAWNLPDKVSGTWRVTEGFRDLDEAIPDGVEDALVFVASDEPERFTTFRYPFLRNPPGLDGPVLFPADRHAENALLLRTTPNRTGYLLHREIDPGDDIFDQHWSVTPLRVRAGRSVDLAVHVTRLPTDVEGLSVLLVADGRRVPAERAPLHGPTTVRALIAGAPGEACAAPEPRARPRATGGRAPTRSTSAGTGPCRSSVPGSACTGCTSSARRRLCCGRM
jgi:hypothetical protein